MRITAVRMIGLVAFAAMAGCASAPPAVTAVDQDAYHLSVSGSRYQTQADTNSKALSAANDYCGNMGKQLMFRQSTETGDHSWSPKQEDLTFVCIDAKEPSYMRAGLKHDTVVVAQQ
jgi:hypothetical protein